MMPARHGVLIIVRVQKLAPSMAQCLFGGGATIVIPTLIPVLNQAIWSSCPHELRQRFGQHTPVLLAGFELLDRKSTRLNSSHQIISYAVFCLKKKKNSSQYI